MRSDLQFDFIVDKEKNTLTIRREFRASRQLVWNCYTKSDLLNQWFAPKPLTTRTKSMDFREGGHWHYAMVDPQGTAYWGYTVYVRIRPIEYYSTWDVFSNEAGEVNQELPRGEWKVRFIDSGSNTLVESVITYPSLHDLETVIKMGMEQGMTATLEKLDELLQTLINQ